MPRPVMGVGATNWNGDGAVTAGAGSGAAGAGSRVAGADEAVRRGAGSARRGGRGLGRGALTVTSGKVSEIWPQAASTPVKAPDASAPSAAARNKRRFAAASRDASRPSPPAPRMAPTGEFPQILEHPPAPGLMRFCQFLSGTFGNVAAGTHLAGDRRDAPPRMSGRLAGDVTGEAVAKLKKALELWRRSWSAHPAFG